ncbi:hypothetical protein TcWFU_003661 [Taenia crassiceps]|uniref:Uncharacterized protein n=1 Tax=Taenia crassiceps TaxID=6207 RepID=A0ABR4QGJ7_9CEST
MRPHDGTDAESDPWNKLFSVAGSVKRVPTAWNLDALVLPHLEASYEVSPRTAFSHRSIASQTSEVHANGEVYRLAANPL